LSIGISILHQARFGLLMGHVNSVWKPITDGTQMETIADCGLRIVDCALTFCPSWVKSFLTTKGTRRQCQSAI
jgi:hypothetical protein